MSIKATNLKSHQIATRACNPSALTSPSGSTAPRTRSLVLGPGVEKTRFWIDVNDGEIDLIFQSLGLNGPDDFEIPMVAYEAMKTGHLLTLLQV